MLKLPVRLAACPLALALLACPPPEDDVPLVLEGSGVTAGIEDGDSLVISRGSVEAMRVDLGSVEIEKRRGAKST